MIGIYVFFVLKVDEEKKTVRLHHYPMMKLHNYEEYIITNRLFTLEDLLKLRKWFDKRIDSKVATSNEEYKCHILLLEERIQEIQKDKERELCMMNLPKEIYQEIYEDN